MNEGGTILRRVDWLQLPEGLRQTSLTTSLILETQQGSSEEFWGKKLQRSGYIMIIYLQIIDIQNDPSLYAMKWYENLNKFKRNIKKYIQIYILGISECRFAVNRTTNVVLKRPASVCETSICRIRPL